MSEQPTLRRSSSAFRKGIVFTGSSSVVSLVSLFLETLIAARLLTTDQFGAYILLITIVNFVVVAVDCGAKTAVTQMIASSNVGRQAALASSVLLFRLMIIAGISAAVWASQGILMLLDSALAAYIVYIPLMLAAASFDELFLSMLQGFQLYKHMAAAQILRSVLRLVLSALLLLVFHMGIIGLIYSWTISFVLSIIYQTVVLPTAKRLDWQRLLIAEMLRFGFPLYMTRFLWFALGRADIMLLAALAGPSSVAFYAVATRIPDALQRLAESYVQVFFPTMSALVGRQQHSEAGQLFSRSLRLISFGTAVIALTAVLFNQEIMILLFEQKYAASGWAFAVLMVGFHIIFTLNLMGYTLTAAGQSMRSFGASLVQAAANIAGNLLLIPALGFVGSALADMLSAYAASGAAMLFMRKGAVLVTLSPHVRQTLLLFACAGWFWWAQPSQIVYRLGMIGLFIALSIAFSNISWNDIQLVLPAQKLPTGTLADADSGNV